MEPKENLEESNGKFKELYSEELDEIINRPPSFLFEWGMTVILSSILVMTLISWFIKYPDLLNATVEITTNPRPVTLVARGNGQLAILRKEGDFVKKDEIVGYISTTVQWDDILKLEASLNDSNSSPKPKLHIGDFEALYGDFLSAEEELLNFYRLDPFRAQIRQLKDREKINRKLLEALKTRLSLVGQETSIAASRFKMDSSLFSNNVTSLADFSSQKSQWIAQQRNLNYAQASILESEMQQNSIQSQIVQLELDEAKQKKKLLLTLENSKRSLLAQIAHWKETYLLTAPISGKLAYQGFRDDNVYVTTGSSIFSIIPITDSLVAHAELPFKNSGKIKVGQAVNIRLDNFPFEQFGILEGRVESVSLMPHNSKYHISISLPEGLVTRSNQKLQFRQQLIGTTEIITEDVRLLERFLYGFRKTVALQVQDQEVVESISE